MSSIERDQSYTLLMALIQRRNAETDPVRRDAIHDAIDHLLEICQSRENRAKGR